MKVKVELDWDIIERMITDYVSEKLGVENWKFPDNDPLIELCEYEDAKAIVFVGLPDFVTITFNKED